MIFHRLKNAPGIAATIFKMSKLAWQAQPACFVGLIILKIIQGLVPLALAWLTKVLFDLLARSLQGGKVAHLSQDLLLLLAAQTGLSLMNQAISPIQQYLNQELGYQLTLKMQTNVYEKINRFVGLIYFEDSRFHDTIQLAAQRAQQGPSQVLNILTALGQNAVTLLGFLGVLIAFNPLLAVAMALTVLPQFYAQMKQGSQRFKLAFGNSRKERRATYLSYILTGIPFAKEVRLLNLGKHFLHVFVHLSEEIRQSQRSQQQRELRWQIALGLLSSVVVSGAFVVVVLQAFAGHLSLGDVTLYISAVMSVQSSLTGMVFALSQINESMLFYNQYTALLAIPQPFSSQMRPIPPLRSGIEFCNVSFRYDEQHSWVLRHLNLSISAGQCVALVGLNGAGKTTLVKLLTRLYDPTEGYILWDGIDIREFDPTDLRSHVGTILQDFVHYDLTAYENIGLGDIVNMNHSSAVHQAAMKAGIHETIESLPHGYETPLSRWLGEEDTGTDLSGGEWQKIALARMFMRNAELLILDEPTAALDAQAEYELHSHFVELVAERTSLLITHRFSTVRMANAIAVLENGRIMEYGTHNELAALKGIYAHLYEMQAKRYQ
jgi:ATP-binding cassette subfamily B protein